MVSKAAARRSIDKLRIKRELEVLTKVQPSPFLQRCIKAFEVTSLCNMFLYTLPTLLIMINFRLL